MGNYVTFLGKKITEESDLVSMISLIKLFFPLEGMLNGSSVEKNNHFRMILGEIFL